MRVEAVTSAQNPKIKTLLALQEKARLRKEMGLFVVEGRRELEHCAASGFEIDTLFICQDIAGQAAGPEPAIRSCAHTHNANPFLTNAGQAAGPEPAIRSCAHTRRADPFRANAGSGPLPALQILEQAKHIVDVPKELYDKIAYRGGTEGIIAEVKVMERSLEDLDLPESPLIAVLEGVEKPGNLGAVLRSADAAGVDAVLICDPLTDLFNPNLIRASIGAVFTVPVVCCPSEEAIKWLKANRIRIYTAQLQDSEWYYDTDMKGATAIAIGTEATGLTDQWREAADAHIRIPMLGQLDSLNASVSAAILLFEAVRQRNG